ncbi:NERD domain-containing protein [Bacillus sp. HMF5848]|uniref:nuclease-related domain-containing protein n=1 Tax=Bacillus sp. HMF5848 TaxID=2495421 RepID=UPI000F773B20|nr:nuclease-related domain-containing protein [Bacillus sp. HMF5848]RSK28680.1 NERD domain-containing protein [Bacillus sp. HMF5848]
MINREHPLHIQQEEAVLERIHESHSSRETVANDISAGLSGDYGEKQTNYYFKQSQLQESYTYGRLRLWHEDYFQIDKLVASRNVLIPVEVKNMSDELIFTSNGQFIQKKQGVEIKYQNPLSQVSIQRTHLERWLRAHSIHTLPVEHLVVFTHKTSIIRNPTNDQQVAERVLTVENLPSKINQILRSHSSPVISQHQFETLNQLFITKHEPFKIDIFKKYPAVSRDDIQKGVICPRCAKINMHLIRDKWYCPACGHKDTNCHQEALYSHFLLYGGAITNQQASEFLLCNDRQTNRILSSPSSGLHRIGARRGTKYFMPIDQRPDIFFIK